MTRIYIVDDDPAFRGMLANYLEGQSIQVRCSSSGDELARQFVGGEPDLILLDLRLNEEDGLDLLRSIRSRSDIPVIIMTGHHRDEIDRVLGLELGADDYVTKPFGLRELLARVRAILRRQRFGRSFADDDQPPAGFAFGGWELRLRSRRLVDAQGRAVSLTKGEYALLVAFLTAPDRPLTREHLLQATRVHDDVFDRSIDVQVLRLRRKLELNHREPQTIQTERGIGYRFTPPVRRL